MSNFKSKICSSYGIRSLTRHIIDDNNINFGKELYNRGDVVYRSIEILIDIQIVFTRIIGTKVNAKYIYDGKTAVMACEITDDNLSSSKRLEVTESILKEICVIL